MNRIRHSRYPFGQLIQLSQALTGFWTRRSAVAARLFVAATALIATNSLSLESKRWRKEEGQKAKQSADAKDIGVSVFAAVIRGLLSFAVSPCCNSFTFSC